MFNEPPISQDDTHPTQTVPQVVLHQPTPAWQRVIGIMLLFAALLLTAGTTVLVMTPVEQTVIVVTSTPTQPAEVAIVTTDSPTITPTTETVSLMSSEALPTLSYDAKVSLLATPVDRNLIVNSIKVARNRYDPFTIIPDRPRNQVETYTIQKGDTINAIAERFGVTPETIAWSNDRREVWVLSVGAQLYILPEDGVYHQAVGDATIAEIAAQYGVTNPTVVLESEYNNLRGLGPDSVPPSGTRIVIPGGVAEAINWSPGVQTVSGGGGSGGGGGDGLVTFDPTSPGSCAPQVPGTAGGWSNPLTYYTFMRGYTSFHPGVDLSAATGTPVAAANSGRVIFAGRSNYGYGLAVVLSHGAFATLYGHLSAINVGCGNLVGSGQTIGAVGSTGNSSGPHLHFEIHYGGVPTNPTEILPF
jgi:murein DD-endopeptidase MepM/ murein hydrolase activator NlpD